MQFNSTTNRHHCTSGGPELRERNEGERLVLD
jgi:hypothetical protein